MVELKRREERRTRVSNMRKVWRREKKEKEEIIHGEKLPRGVGG